MEESRDFYVRELVRVTGIAEDELLKLSIQQLADLYEQRVINGRGMI